MNFLIDATKVFLLLASTGSPMKNSAFNFGQTLIVFKKSCLLFSKTKISGSSNTSGLYYFLFNFFFWRFAHVFSLTISTKVCAENFLLFFNWKILKKIEKVLVSTCFMKPGFPIFDYNHRTKQNIKVLVHIFADIENITKRIHVENFWRKW